MFFLIAGVQPKTADLDNHPRRCPSCGLHQAYLRRIDHYLSIFFLPLVRVKKGNPFLECQSCGGLFHERGEPGYGYQVGSRGKNCPHCGNPLEPGFNFCPFCGRPA